MWQWILFKSLIWLLLRILIVLINCDDIDWFNLIIYLFIYLFVYSFVYLFIYLCFVMLFIYLFIYLFLFIDIEIVIVLITGPPIGDCWLTSDSVPPGPC